MPEYVPPAQEATINLGKLVEREFGRQGDPWDAPLIVLTLPTPLSPDAYPDSYIDSQDLAPATGGPSRSGGMSASWNGGPAEYSPVGSGASRLVPSYAPAMIPNQRLALDALSSAPTPTRRTRFKVPRTFSE